MPDWRNVPDPDQRSPGPNGSALAPRPSSPPVVTHGHPRMQLSIHVDQGPTRIRCHSFCGQVPQAAPGLSHRCHSYSVSRRQHPQSTRPSCPSQRRGSDLAHWAARRLPPLRRTRQGLAARRARTAYAPMPPTEDPARRLQPRCPSQRRRYQKPSQSPQIAARIRRQILGVALFGDPYFNSRDHISARGSYVKGLNGVLGTRSSFLQPTRVLSYCRKHDPVCQSPLSFLHLASYRFTEHKKYGSAAVDADCDFHPPFWVADAIGTSPATRRCHTVRSLRVTSDYRIIKVNV